MRTSQLIQRLQWHLEEHGDLEACHGNLVNDEVLPIEFSHIDAVQVKDEKRLIIMNPQLKAEP